MKVDLRKDAQVLRASIAERVGDYPIYVNAGPGRDEDQITQITLGYQFDQSGWVTLVFDTRPNAHPDGEWNNFIEDNWLEMPHWNEHLWDGHLDCTLVLSSGKKKAIPKKFDEALCAKVLGEELKSVLLRCRGLLKKLPLADSCVLTVEHQEGGWGWTEYDDGEQSSDAFLGELDGQVGRKSSSTQITHWIDVLDQFAKGKFTDTTFGFLVLRHSIERLDEIGEASLVPLLQLVRKWADREEFERDRPKRKLGGLPHSEVASAALHHVHKSSASNPEVERLLREILRRSLKANAARNLWGTTPIWSARCLSKLFDGYPQPRQNPNTNALKNHEAFSKRR